LGVDPDPRIHASDQRIQILLFSSVTFKMARQLQLFFFISFFVYYFLKLHLHNFSKIKSQKEVTKQDSRFFLLFLHDDRRIRIWIQIHTSD
jgi:hypothetical protein